MHIGIVGAGAMGKGIAKNLKQAGHDVLAYKRKIDEQHPVIHYLRTYDIPISTQLNKLFEQSEVLVTCLPDSPTVESILIGSDGLINAKLSSVQCVLEFSTAHPKSTQKVAAMLQESGIDILDTPMTGGPAEADKGEIRLAVGGKREILEKYRNLLEQVSEKIVYAGNRVMVMQ